MSVSAFGVRKVRWLAHLTVWQARKTKPDASESGLVVAENVSRFR